MEAFKERLLLEYRELHWRKSSLGDFIQNNPKFNQLPQEMQSLMKKQLEEMGNYEDCLRARCNHIISHEEIDEYDHPSEIVSDKRLRISLDTILQKVKLLPASRERKLTITKLQEAIMWLGMDLKRLNPDNDPYINSKDASNEVIDPTADGLKL